MAKDKKLIDLYTEWKQIQSYKDGGKVTDESSDEAIALKAKKYSWTPEQVQHIKQMRDSSPAQSSNISVEIPQRKQNPNPYQNFAEFATRPTGYADGGVVNPLDSLSQEQYEQLRIAPRSDLIEGSDIDSSLNLGPYKNESGQLSTGKEERDAQLASGFDPNTLLDEPSQSSSQNIQEGRQKEIASQDQAKMPSEQDALAGIEQRKQAVADADIPLSPDQSIGDKNPEDNQSALTRLLASLKPQASNNDLKDAQRQRDMNIASQQIAKGAALAASGFSKTKPDRILNMIGENDKYVNLPVQKYDENINNLKFDPSSTMSQAYRQLYTKLTGQAAPDSWSAADLEKVSPVFEKFIQARETAQAKKEAAQQNLEFKQQRAAELDELRKQGLISQDQFRKALIELKGKQVDQADARIGLTGEKSIQNDPTIKKANDRINSADTALTQLNDKSQPLTMNRLNAIQIDLASTLNFMSSQGASDYKAKSDKLENLQTKIAALQQKYGNKLIDLRVAAPEVYKEVSTYAQSVKDSVQAIRNKQDKHLRDVYSKSLGGNAAAQRIQDNGKKEEVPKSAQSAEVERLDPKSGKIAVFDANSKQFLRWK